MGATTSSSGRLVVKSVVMRVVMRALMSMAVLAVTACEDPLPATRSPEIDDPARSFTLDAPQTLRETMARPAPDASGLNNSPVRVRELVLASATPIEIEGVPSLATAVLQSGASRPLGAFYWFLDITQGSSWVEAAWGWADCGAGVGIVPPGRCALRDLSFRASHSGRHIGVLVPGPASLSMVLYHARDGRAAQVAVSTIPVLLSAAADTSVLVTPAQAEFPASGGTVQLTATVFPTGTPQGVLWTSSNASVATVSSTGLVTAWNPGASLVLASSVASPTKQGASLISVGTTPVLGTGVNASPGAWDAVPGMQLSFAAQVVDGPQQVTWSSSSPASVAVTSPHGRATAVSPFTNATLTARSVADNSQFANVNVRVFSLDWRAPSSATLVSTGAVMPPANPLSVTLQAQACQAVTVTAPPFRAATYELVVGTGTVTIGQSTSFQVFDTGTMRCWVYPFTWTPGTAFGTGAQVLRTTMIDHFGGAGGRVVNSFVTITTP